MTAWVKVGPGRYRREDAPDTANIVQGKARKSQAGGSRIGRITPAMAALKCDFLGGKVPDMPCGIPLYQCNELNTTVSRVKPCKGANAVCTECDFRVAFPDKKYAPVAKRHLVCHVMPITGNGVWQRNMSELKARWSLFDGVKVISVATGRDHHSKPLDPPSLVKAALPSDAILLDTPNKTSQWEGVSWQGLWTTVLANAGDDDAVFYCHAKGVTRPPNSLCHEWADLLREVCLDYWSLVSRGLESCPVVGPLRKLTGFPPSPGGFPLKDGGWYYSGNFWWVRAGEMKSALARVGYPEESPWAPEAWVGLAWKPHEAGAIGPLSDRPDLHEIYNRKWWTDVARPLVEKWRAARGVVGLVHKANPPPREAYHSLHVITPCSRPENLGAIAESMRPLRKHFQDLVWRVAYSDGGTGFGGTERTRALVGIPHDAWVCFLDDDTLVHPQFGENLKAALAEHPDADGFVFNQVNRDGSRRLRAVTSPRVGQVDTGMFVFKGWLTNDQTWGNEYESDYKFFSAVAAPGDRTITAIDKPGSIYNALRVDEPRGRIVDGRQERPPAQPRVPVPQAGLPGGVELQGSPVRAVHNQPPRQAVTRGTGGPPQGAEPAEGGRGILGNGVLPGPDTRGAVSPTVVKPLTWCYGVTTVPQRRDLLTITLNCLSDGGFDKPHLFVDGCDDPRWYRTEFGLEVTARYPRVRAFNHWILTLAELYCRDAYADRYAVFQDDLLCPLGLRTYLDWSTVRPAVNGRGAHTSTRLTLHDPRQEKVYWNLFTLPSNQDLCPPGHVGWYTSSQLGRGAVGLVFNREGVKALLGSRQIISRPHEPGKHGNNWKNIDGAIQGALVLQLGFRELVHSPSLIQHTGHETTLKDPRLPHPKQPDAPKFPGVGYDLTQLIAGAKAGVVT